MSDRDFPLPVRRPPSSPEAATARRILEHFGLDAQGPLCGLDESSVQVFGEAKAILERRGQRLADADLLIGAIAVVQRATVVTGNRRHYERIPGVTVENWIRD